ELGDLDWLVNYRPPDLLNPGLGESDATGQPPAAEAAGAASVKKEPFPQSTFASCGNRFHSGYDPHKDRLLKPPYSFSCLIFMALEAAPNKCLPVRRIYQWIEQKFPFYRQAQNGWKNSVRHNLSLNKSFTKVQRDTSAKGSLWTIDPMARAGMLQALKKTPYHPYAQVQMFSATGTMYKTGGGGMRRETKSPLPLQQQQQQGSSYSSVLGTNALLAHSSAMVKMDDNVSSNCDDELASVSDIQQQQQQQRMQYHPNVNSFKGHAADGQQLAGSDATSLRELRRQRGDIVDVDVDEDEDDDEDEDGYVEIEQPIKRPRGRPRKDCAQMYRLLPPARLLKKKKRKRR
uniref:Fork-head domain-containing protein n=1 Tax=Macrostomum lignano TaxID=282301 RepID=A0A1I8IF13_9PLAT